MRREGEEIEVFRFWDGEDLDKWVCVCVWWNVGIKELFIESDLCTHLICSMFSSILILPLNKSIQFQWAKYVFSIIFPLSHSYKKKNMENEKIKRKENRKFANSNTSSWHVQ